MAKGFNLTAELNLRGPSNVRQIVSNINKQLKTVKATVNLSIDPNSAKSIASINKSLSGLNKNLKTVLNTSQALSNNLSGIGAQFNNVSTAATKTANSISSTSKSISATGSQAAVVGGQISKATTLMEDFGKQSALAVKRFAAFSLVTSAVFSLTNAISQAFDQFVEFDRQLVRLQQVTGKTADGLKGISREITNLSTNLGVSSSQLIAVSTTLAQAGLSARDTEQALKALALSALAPSFDDLNRTVEGSIALMRQFGISANQLEQALGSVNAVAASFAVEAGDIIAAIQRTGGVFAAASKGVSEGTDALNEFIAVFTSVRATTRESAETIATGLRTIFTRIQRGSTIEALKEFGITLTDVDGKFVGAYKAIQLLSQGLNQLDPRDIKFSTLVEELGGFRQIGKVIPLIQQFATAQQALAVAQAGQGSLAEDAATAQLSLATQVAKVREEFLGLIREIGGTDSFKAITKSALDLASALIQIADSVKGVLPVLSLVLAGKGLRAGFGFAKGFGKELKGKAQGGLVTAYAKGGLVDVALMPGETVVSPEVVKKIGIGTLNRMNKADKMAKGGLAKVPGTGRTDSFYTQIPENSYVIRTDATNAMGDKTISDIASGRQKFADGGQTKKTQQGKQVGGVGVFDSDMIGAGSKQILKAIRSSGKPYSVVSGPAGSGKTTFATRKFGKNFILSAADIDKYSTFTVLSSAGATKTGDFSTDAKSLMSGADKIIALQPPTEQVIRQRQQRVSDAELSGLPDTRSINQLKGTTKAPTQIDSNLYKKFGNVQFLQKFKDGGKVYQSKKKYGMLVAEEGNPADIPMQSVKKKGDIYQAGIRVSGFKETSTFTDKIKEIDNTIDSVSDELAQSIKVSSLNPSGTQKAKNIASTVKGTIFENYVLTAAGLPDPGNAPFDIKRANATLKGLTQQKVFGLTDIKLNNNEKQQKSIIKKAIKERPSDFTEIPQSDTFNTEDATKIPEAAKSKKTEKVASALGGLIQKFASGGILRDIETDPNLQVGAAVLESVNPSSSPLAISPKDITAAAQRKAGLDPKTEQINQANFNTKNVRGITGVKQGLSKQTETSFRAAIDQGLVEAVNYAGGTLSKDLGLPFTSVDQGSKSSFLSGVNSASVGNLFEDVLTGMSAGYASRIAGQNFDFPGGLGGSLKDNYLGLPEKWVDAKASSKEAKFTGSGSLQAKTLNQIGSEIAANRQIYIKSRDQGTSEDLSKKTDLDPSRTYSLAELKKFGINSTDDAKKRGLTSPFRGKWQMRAMASGGEVPILAQEGEYVINRNSARSIGYGNLEKLNKYHSGGRVQKMAGGGKPTKSAQIGSLGLPSGFAGTLTKAAEQLSAEMSRFGIGLKSNKEAYDKALIGIKQIYAASPDLAEALHDNHQINRRGFRAQARINTEIVKLTEDLRKSGKTHKQQQKELLKATKNLQRENAAASKRFSVLKTVEQQWSRLTKAIKTTTGKMLGMKIGGGMPSDSSWRRGFRTDGNPGRQPRAGGMNATTGLAIALPLITDAFTNSAEATTAATAATNAFAQSLTTNLGVGLILSDTLGDLASSLPGKFGAIGGPIVQGVALVATAAFALAKAYADSQEAARKFNIDEGKRKIEEETENIAKILANIDKTGKALPATLARLDAALKTSTDAALSASDALSNQYRGSVVQNAVEFFGNPTPQGQAEGQGDRSQINRSIILQERGVMAYLSALSSTTTELSIMRSILPKISKESANVFASQAKNIEDVLVAKLKQGVSIGDIMNGPEWSKQAEVLARANAAIEKQILLIDTNTTLTEEEKEARKQNIISLEANRIAAEKVKQVALEKNLASLANATNKLSYSFNRILSNMQNAVAGASSELAQLEANASDLTSSLSGQAVSSGTSEIDKLISVIESPRGFSAAERGTAFNTATRGFGASAGNVSKVLEIGTSIEDTILKTINNITANAAPGTTNEAIGAQVGAAIDRNLSNIGLPPELSNKLSREIGNQVSKLRQSGDDNIDFSEIVEQVPGLGSALETFKTASSAVTANLKFLQESFQKLSSTTNQLIDLQLDSNNRFLRSQQIVIDGYVNLAQALGKNVSLSQQRYSIESNIRGRTGGTTDPSQIRKNITNLSDRKSNLEDKKAAAQAAQDPGLVQEFERKIKQTSVSLNENVAALKDMAESSDLASAALNKIQQAQEKQRAGIGIIEKLVTSTPKQLNELNNSAYRLSRNMAGMGNFGTTGEQRQQDLELFNMIAPLLGDQAEPLKANVLQSMLQQSGIGVTPMFQQILDTMRNPQADPVQAEAIKTYQEAISKQSDANNELAKINNTLADDIANQTAKAIADAISKVRLQFDTSQLSDIVTNTNRPDLDQPKPAQGIATGGLIYKADGGNVNKTIFQPKGTDTVPAMLTPGEFVVNRKATSKNLPLLKSINNGKMSSDTRYYAAGGLVKNNFLKDDLEPDQSANIKVSNDPLKIINDSFFSSNNSNNSSILGARFPLYPQYSSQKSFIEPIRTELGQSAINNTADWIEELGILGNFMPQFWLWGRIAGGISRFARLAVLSTVLRNNGIDPAKNLTGWGVGRPSSIVEGGSFISSFRSLANGDDDKFWKEVLRNVTSVAVLGGAITDKLTGGLLPEYTLAPNNFTPDIKNLGTLPFQVGDITSGAFPSLFSGPVKLNQQPELTDLTSYNSNDGSTSASKSIKTQIKLAKELKKRIATINENITAEQFVDPENISKSDANFTEIEGGTNWYLYNLPFPLDPVAQLKKADQYTSMQVSDASVDFATNINEASNTLGVTGKDFGIGNNSVAQGQQQGIDPQTVIGFLSQKNAKIQEIDQYLSTLNNYNKNKNFKSLSTEKIDFNKIEKLMSEIKNDQLPKLYANIPNKYLNDTWKTKVGGDDLSVWKSTLTDKWKSDYLDVQGENPDLLQGVYLGSNPVKVKGSKRAWSASSRSEDIATYFQAQLDQVQKEAKEKSEFKVGELQQSSLYNIGTANELLEGLGQKDINVAFGYRTIDMPKYTKKTGYTKPEGKLQGIIPVLGNTIDPFTIDPFIKEVSKGSPENLYDNPEIFANELREYYRSILENSWNAKTGESTGGSAFKFGGKVLNKIQSETLANIDPNGDAREIVRGATTADWYTLLPALKEKILSQVGAEIQQVESDKDASFKALDLETLQKTAKGVISPFSRILARARVFIPNLTGLEGLSPFGDYLNQASDYVGSFVQNPNSPLVNVFGQLKALGEIFSLFGANKVDSAFSALGVGREAFSKPDGDSGDSTINDAASLAKAIQTYGILKSKQGLLSLGGDTSVLSATIDKNGKLGDTGQKIAEVFKSGKIELADVNTESGGFTTTTASEAQAPKDLKEVGKIVLNPYNVMPSNVRTALTTGLVTSLQQARLGYAAQAVSAVGGYLAKQDDFLLADGDNPATADKDYKSANQALLLLTDGALGLLPNAEKLEQMKTTRAQQQKQQQAQTKARGGLIYASNGTLVNFQPQGTDTVPAMLTPGEFVINKQSTQKHLPLLKAINGSKGKSLSQSQAVQQFAVGGVVQPRYYAEGSGGAVPGGLGGSAVKLPQLQIDNNSVTKAKNAISEAFVSGAAEVAKLVGQINISESSISAINSFTNSVDKIVNNMANINIPPQIQFTGNVQVNLTGASNLTEAAESIVNSAIKKAFGSLGVANEGSLTIPQAYR